MMRLCCTTSMMMRDIPFSYSSSVCVRCNYIKHVKIRIQQHKKKKILAVAWGIGVVAALLTSSVGCRGTLLVLDIAMDRGALLLDIDSSSAGSNKRYC